MKLYLNLLGCILLIGIAAGFWFGQPPVMAQDSLIWTTPRRIPDYNDPLRAPFLVADQNQTVYAFNHETTAQQFGVIVFRRWSLAQGWSAPVDIFALGERTGPQEVRGVVLDEDGKLHLIYYSGTERSGSVQYSWAYAAAAGNASSWSSPVSIADNAGPVAAGAVVRAGPQHLVVVFGGQALGIGLYEVHSLDGGQTWSRAVPVSLSAKPNVWPSAVWLAADAAGGVHAVWYIVNQAGVGELILYARRAPRTGVWEQETVIARQDTSIELMGFASIITSGDRLIIAYQDGFPPTRWVRQSTDNGDTWTNPVRPFPHIGAYEHIVLLSDSNGIVHMIMGNRLSGPPDIHGMWHSQLDGEIWTPLEPIISGPRTNTFDPCCAQAVISQGNVLLAAWPHNVGNEYLTGAWYSYAQLNAPELPLVAPPMSNEATAEPATTQEMTITATTTIPPPTPLPTLSAAESEPEAAINPAVHVFVAIVPVLLVGAGFIAALVIRRQVR